MRDRHTHTTLIVMLALGALAVSLCSACRSSVPHHIWPKTDMESRAVAGETESGKVLITAQKSDYKSLVVEELTAKLQSVTARVEVTGLNALKEIDPAQYDALVLINTCMAWEPDPRAVRFLNAHPEVQERTVLFTTSGDGSWLPDLQKRSWSVDALSGASAVESAGTKAARIYELIAPHL